MILVINHIINFLLFYYPFPWSRDFYISRNGILMPLFFIKYYARSDYNRGGTRWFLSGIALLCQRQHERSGSGAKTGSREQSLLWPGFRQDS
jgi:hypothetical protein